MANIIANGGNIPAAVVADMFNAVRGKSALAKISENAKSISVLLFVLSAIEYKN